MKTQSIVSRACLMAQLVKNLPAVREAWIQSLGWDDPLEKGFPLQYSGLENSMDYIVHGVAKSGTQLSDFSFHFFSTFNLPTMVGGRRHSHVTGKEVEGKKGYVTCPRTHSEYRWWSQGSNPGCVCHLHPYPLTGPTCPSASGDDGCVVHSFNLIIIIFFNIWRRQWHPTPVLLPGKSYGRRSLVGCSPWGC